MNFVINKIKCRKLYFNAKEDLKVLSICVSSASELKIGTLIRKRPAKCI